MNNAIEVSSLYKTYSRPFVEALRGIDLSIPRGQCIGILGPNGSGKTTLIEIMQGLRQPTSGHISVLGKSYKNQETEIRSSIGGVLQENGIWNRIHVKEILQLFSSFYKNAIPLQNLIERFRLEKFLNRPLATLSGGQRQNVFLAMAIVGDPELIFLDEPTTGLDPRIRREFWNLISELKSEGRTIILTTHYLEEAEVLCDEVSIIKKGILLASGTPEALSIATARRIPSGLPADLNEIYLAMTEDMDS